MDKAIGKETVAAALDFPQPLEAKIEGAKDTKKTEFKVIKHPRPVHSLRLSPYV